MSARDSVGLTALGPITLQDHLLAGYFPFSNSQLFLAKWNAIASVLPQMLCGSLYSANIATAVVFASNRLLHLQTSNNDHTFDAATASSSCTHCQTYSNMVCKVLFNPTILQKQSKQCTRPDLPYLLRPVLDDILGVHTQSCCPSQALL